MDRPAAFRDWIVKRLRYIIDLREQSVASVEKAMGKSRGYLADALRGEKRLPLESLLEVLEHLEIDPREFFSGLTAEEERWVRYPRAEEVADATGIADPHGSGDRRIAGADGETRRLLLAVIRVLEAKGLVDHDEVMAALAQHDG